MFENNLKLKEIAPEWFKDIDPTEEILQDILSLGFVQNPSFWINLFSHVHYSLQVHITVLIEYLAT